MCTATNSAIQAPLLHGEKQTLLAKPRRVGSRGHARREQSHAPAARRGRAIRPALEVALVPQCPQRPRGELYRSQIVQVSIRWKALAEIYTMHSFAPFSNRIPKNEENHRGKRSWSNPEKTSKEKLMSSRNSLPRTTLARDLNKGHVTSMRI